MPGMKMISLLLPEPYIEMLEDLVREELFPHRSEAIREAIRTLLDEHGKILEWMEKHKTKKR